MTPHPMTGAMLLPAAVMSEALARTTALWAAQLDAMARLMGGTPRELAEEAAETMTEAADDWSDTLRSERAELRPVDGRMTAADAIVEMGDHAEDLSSDVADLTQQAIDGDRAA